MKYLDMIAENAMNKRTMGHQNAMIIMGRCLLMGLSAVRCRPCNWKLLRLKHVLLMLKQRQRPPAVFSWLDDGLRVCPLNGFFSGSTPVLTGSVRATRELSAKRPRDGAAQKLLNEEVTNMRILHWGYQPMIRDGHCVEYYLEELLVYRYDLLPRPSWIAQPEPWLVMFADFCGFVHRPFRSFPL